MSFIKNLLKINPPQASGVYNKAEGSIVGTPVMWWDERGVCVARSGSVWLYRELTNTPLKWEDNSARLSLQAVLENTLLELGATSVDRFANNARFANLREIHILSLLWEEAPNISKSAPPALQEYLYKTLNFTVPQKTTVLGILLKPTTVLQTTSKGGVVQAFKDRLTTSIGEGVPDLSLYEKDYALIDDILTRNGASVLTPEKQRRLDFWYNHGTNSEILLARTENFLYNEETDTKIEMAVLHKFNEAELTSPGNPFLLDAFAHADGVSVASVRALLKPASIVRSELRTSQRRVLNQIAEEAQTGDLERPEQVRMVSLTAAVEDFVQQTQQPILSNVSFVFGRVMSDSPESYIDFLRNRYGIDVIPLLYRQLEALDETLPGSTMRVNPFLQSVTPSTLAYAGITDFSSLGDNDGFAVGIVDPQGTVCYLNSRQAPRANKSNAVGIFGDPGSGKTFLTEMIATQATLAGETVVFINPKNNDSLAAFAEGVGGTVLPLSSVSKVQGFYDPFRWLPPDQAADTARRFITSVLTDLSQEEGGALGYSLKKGALAGERCVFDALKYGTSERVLSIIDSYAESSPLFALGIGKVPQESLVSKGGLTLIEFDRPVPLPAADQDQTTYKQENLEALAGLRLIALANLQLLSESGGGVFIADEAWTLLSNPELIGIIDNILRTGRSRNVMSIFATQKPSDLLNSNYDFESFMPRAFTLNLSSSKEAIAGLTICGLEPTQERINWLKTLSPPQRIPGTPTRPAYALHKDLSSRHAAISIGPVAEEYYLRWSTNPADRALRDAAMPQQ